MGEQWPDFNEMVNKRYQFSFGSDFNPIAEPIASIMGSIAVQRCVYPDCFIG